MRLVLNQIGKQYQFKWILRGLSVELPSGSRVAIQGHNGSGKSTLIKILAGYLSPSAGAYNAFVGENLIERDMLFRHLSLAAPYMDLISEFTVQEMIGFHCKARGVKDPGEILRFCYLEEAVDLQIQFLSSGMLQRLKLGLALSTPASLYLFDEPGTNLDSRGQSWFMEAVSKLPTESTLIIASNAEADFVQDSIRLEMPYIG